jgi:hypothetical protein
MKTRSGFVSNSSSSSFLLAFPREPKSEKDIVKMLFKKEKFVRSICDEFDFPVKELSCRIFSKIHPRELLMECCGIIDGGPSSSDFFVDSKFDQESYDKAVKDYTEKTIAEFVVENIGSYLCVVSFDDDSSMDSTLKNGMCFHNIPHICISSP